MSQLSVHSKMQKPVKGKHPAYTCTKANEPVEIHGVDCLPETSSKRTRCPLPNIPLRRRLTD